LEEKKKMIRQQSAAIWGQLVRVARGLIAGVSDSLRWSALLIFYLASPTIRDRSLSCLVLNGAVYLGSIAIMELCWIPLAQWTLPNTVVAPLRLLLQLLWLYPMMLLSMVLNGFWYTDVANHAHNMQLAIDGGTVSASTKKTKMAAASASTNNKTRALHQANPLATFLVAASEAIYLASLLAALSLQMLLISLVLPQPLVFCSNLVHTAFLCSLSCFDYRWSLEGWTLEYRLRAFERRWAYFLGFGLPAALLSVALPYFVAVGVYALAFPILVRNQRESGGGGDREKKKRQLTTVVLYFDF